MRIYYLLIIFITSAFTKVKPIGSDFYLSTNLQDYTTQFIFEVYTILKSFTSLFSIFISTSRIPFNSFAFFKVPFSIILHLPLFYVHDTDKDYKQVTGTLGLML